MRKFAHFIVRHRKAVIIVAVLLLIPSIIGAAATKINYDVLTYLPSDLDSMTGEKALEEDFHLASTAVVTVENLPEAQLLDLKQRIAKVPGVSDAFWISDVLDPTVPAEVLPGELYDTMFSSDGATMLIVRFDDTSSSKSTMSAIKKIKKITAAEAYLGGASVILQDTKEIVDGEMPLYIVCAVGACLAVLYLSLSSNATPIIFMVGLAFPILYNFGTNIIFGQISYITEALATVLQLGVTMDYSIFLLHRYEEERNEAISDEEAMEKAIVNTSVSISASSLTTIAGFLALCTMRLTLGTDIGLVMAKGVALGVLSTITVLPSLILQLNKWVYRHQHRVLVPKLTKTSYFITRHYKGILAAFIVIFIPFALAEPKTKVYYTLSDSLPQDMTGIVGTEKMKEDFGMTTTYFVLVDKDLKDSDIRSLGNELEKVAGVRSTLSLQKFVGAGVPEDLLPSRITDIFEAGGYKLLLVNSSYKTGSDSANRQVAEITKLVKSFDASAVVTGEAPMTKDLIEIASVDFQNVNWASIIAIFAIIALSFRSFSIPVLLVAAIEAAIYINMGIPYFTGTTLPFIASIVIGTIQLGATVDYAILMTSRFEEELSKGHTKLEAVQIAIENCSQSILTSGLSFFAATIGASLVSRMALLKSICLLVARGALVSMFVIINILPALLIIFEPVIRHTTWHWAVKKGA